MTKKTEEKIIELLRKEKESNNDAKELLKEIFRDQVLDMFYDSFDPRNAYAHNKDDKDCLESNTKFVNSFAYYDDQLRFIEEHWDDVGTMREIIKGAIKKGATEK